MKHALAILGLVTISSAASAKPTAAPSCAAQWITAHGKPTIRKADLEGWRAYEKAAAPAGSMCVFHTADQGPVIGEAAVRTLLTRQMTAATSFVARPPTDITSYCAHYAALDAARKLIFWQNLFVRIAYHESDRFRTRSLMMDYPEYSIGLYQMSINNGCKMIGSEADLGDTAKNTACAIHKMSVLATAPGIIGGDAKHAQSGAAAYWSTLRQDSQFRADVVQYAAASPGCSG